MTASKVTISLETRAKLDNPILSEAKKRSLREEMIKERIRNTASGACTLQELVAAAGFDPDATTSEYARGQAIVKTMVNRGVLAHNETTVRRKNWVVVGDIKTTKVKPTPKEVAEAAVAPKEEASAVPTEPTVELKEFPALTSMSLQDMAKEFAWRHNSDSLREFINYVKDAIK